MTDKTADVVGLLKFSGRYEGGVLKGTMTRRDNPTFKGVCDLKARKE